jgi:Flp pilus assembly protein TadG
MLEFALVLPLLLLVVYGIVSFGLVLNLKQTMTQAAEEGARAAVGVPADCTLGASGCTEPSQAYATATSQAASTASAALSYLGSRAPSPTASVGPCPSPGSGTCITVTVTYPYGSEPLIPILPVFSSFVPSTLTSRSIVRLGGPET